MKNKKSNDNLQKLLKSGRFVSGGFLGSDERNYLDIIEDDKIELLRLNIIASEIAVRMREITAKAVAGFGTWVNIDEKLEAKVDEVKGGIPCPWPHQAGLFAKRVTTVRRTDGSREIQWSDLCIHLIAEHGFFQGRGSEFRIEPVEIVRIISPNTIV